MTNSQHPNLNLRNLLQTYNLPIAVVLVRVNHDAVIVGLSRLLRGEGIEHAERG